MISQANNPWAEPFRAIAASGVELCELEMISPIFDLKGHQSNQDNNGSKLPPGRLLILSPPRSGSYYLCRRLWLDGLGMPLEYLNSLHLKAMAKRLRLPLQPCRWRDRPSDRLEQTLSQISSLRSCNGWFALKLQPSQLQPWCRKKDTPIDLLGTVFADWTVIPLLRRDWFRQLASLIISRASGAYDLGLNFSWCDGAGGELLTPRRLSQARRQLEQDLKPIITWLGKHPECEPLWMEELLAWDQGRYADGMLLRLPDLDNDEHQQLRLKLGRIPLQRREDPFATAKSSLNKRLAKQLRQLEAAQPPEAISALLD